VTPQSSPPPAAAPSLREECGLVAPRPALRAWPPDAHLLAAVLVALPLWLALGLFAPGLLRAPAAGWAWVSLVLVQPLLEELVFRGILQGQLLRLTAARRAAGPLSWANLAVSAAFAALHLPTQAPASALAVFFPSLVFGHLRERFGSVWPAVAVHAYYNLGLALTAWLSAAR